MDNKPKQNEYDIKAACPVRDADNSNNSISERLLLNRVKSSGDNRPVHRISNGAWWQPGLLLATQITGWIVGPIVGGLFLGKWLDAKYGTDPWLFLTCIIVAFVITNIGIVREAKHAIQKIEEEKPKFEARNPKSETNSNDRSSNNQNVF